MSADLSADLALPPDQALIDALLAECGERDWLGWDSPEILLRLLGLRGLLRQRGAARKLRLLACAGCRAAWPAIGDGRVGLACQVAERWADGAADGEQLRVASVLASQVAALAPAGSAEEAAAVLASLACDGVDRASLVHLDVWGDQAGLPPARLAELVRDLFGNPYRLGLSAVTAGWLGGAVRERVSDDWARGVALPHHVFAWGGGDVVRIARNIYENRAYGTLGVLADALEVAGCEDVEVLNHCRGRQRCPLCLGGGGNGAAVPGPAVASCGRCGGAGWLRSDVPHARGCWVLDLLLGL